jgi:hypothetical protein
VNRLDYAEALAAAKRGEFVGVVVGRTPKGSAIAWITFPLDDQGQAIACHPNTTVRAAQMLGYLRELGRAAQVAGFTPA